MLLGQALNIPGLLASTGVIGKRIDILRLGILQ